MKRPNDNINDSDIASSLLSIVNEINDLCSLHEESANIMIMFAKELLSKLVQDNNDNITTTQVIANINEFISGQLLKILLGDIERADSTASFKIFVTTSVIGESNVHTMLMITLNYLCYEIIQCSNNVAYEDGSG